MSEKEKVEIIDSLMNTIENLKKENVDIELISKVTGLSKEQIEDL
jgi:hypothetical protein